MASARRDQYGFRLLPTRLTAPRESAGPWPKGPTESTARKPARGFVVSYAVSPDHETGERTFLSTSPKEGRYAGHYCLWHTFRE